MWNNSQVIEWTVLLLDSFRRYARCELIDRSNSETDARVLFEAPIAVVSHGLGSDPILNYGNQTASDLWGVDWAVLTAMPSRLMAEPIEQAARLRMLDEAARRGFIGGYEGIRKTVNGRKFRIHDGVVWNVLSHGDERLGQAAMFPRWTFL